MRYSYTTWVVWIPYFRPIHLTYGSHSLLQGLERCWPLWISEWDSLLVFAPFTLSNVQVPPWHTRLMLQNVLCRIVFRLDKTSYVTPFLQKLHWLPITYRILFKYYLITFKAIKFSQPIYLSSLIKTSCLTRGNRLSLSSVSHKKAIGRRGFVMASPTITTITTNYNRFP